MLYFRPQGRDYEEIEWLSVKGYIENGNERCTVGVWRRWPILWKRLEVEIPERQVAHVGTRDQWPASSQSSQKGCIITDSTTAMGQCAVGTREGVGWQEEYGENGAEGATDRAA